MNSGSCSQISSSCNCPIKLTEAAFFMKMPYILMLEIKD